MKLFLTLVKNSEGKRSRSVISFVYAFFMIVRTIRYEALQSEAGKMLLRRSGRAPDDISSVVLVEKDRYAY